MSVSVWTAASDLDLNVANGNWSRLTELIGMDLDPWNGSGILEDAELRQFAERVAFVLSSLAAMPALDGGTVGNDYRGEGGCRVIECGLRPGYYTDRLGVLLAIAEAAIAANDRVSFG